MRQSELEEFAGFAEHTVLEYSSKIANSSHEFKKHVDYVFKISYDRTKQKTFHVVYVFYQKYGDVNVYHYN